jgi:hypothetical protein
MKKKIKMTLLGLLPIFIALQFVRPTRNIAAVAGPNDLIVRYSPPPAVRQILAVACYDCHSNNTRYPWYANVQPVGWWMTGHINDAKDALNFSEFGSYTTKRMLRKLDTCDDEITNHSMPLPSYRIIHTDARLTPEQIKLLCDWFDSVHDQISDAAAK